MLTISPGHSVEYLTREVATGRENYYTGAVAEGEPPGRWYGAGAEALGLTGLVDHQDMQALYERFLDPRDERFRDPEQWDEVPTLGHAGRKYPTAEEIYQRSLDAEPYADSERREQLRLDASKAERRKNVAFMDVTFSVQKSRHRAARRVRSAGGQGPRRPATRRRPRRGRRTGRRSRTRSGPATTPPWTTCKSTPATPGSGTTAARRAGSSTRTTGPSPRSSSTPPRRTTRSCTSTTRCSGACRARTGGGARWTRAALYLHRPAAGAIAERTTIEHLARVAAACWPRCARTASPARSLGIAGAGQRPVLQPAGGRSPRRPPSWSRAFEQRYGREPNALELDRLQRQATMLTRPREVARRGDPRTAPRPVGARSCAPRSRSAWTRSPPTCSPSPSRKRPSRERFDRGRRHRDRDRRRAGQQGRLDRGRTSPARSTTRCPTTSAGSTASACSSCSTA